MKKIMVVDDDNDLVETLNFYLSYSDYLVLTANSISKMFEMLDTDKPDVILLDIMLPDMDGISACKKLKEDTVLSLIPVMMITAKDRREDVESAIKAGADAYVSKPFSLPRLVERIEELLSRRNIALRGKSSS